MKKRILLIEDEDTVRDVIEALLEQKGYVVDSCATGHDIFNTISRSKPDLILLDILLGPLDGRDLCKAIRNNPETAVIPVIIISGAPNLYNTITEVGANDIILKPFKEDVLLSRIHRQLSNIRIAFNQPAD